MGVPRHLSRAEWIDGGFNALCDGGIDALRIEPLAVRLGVTKGSFYHHFENRRALHMALLDAWERLGTAQIIDDVDAEHGSSVDRLRLLAHRVFAPSGRNDAIETSIRAWAAVDDEVAAAVGRVDDTRLSFVVDLACAVGMSRPLARRRARLFYRALIGEFVWRQAKGPASSKREVDELVDLFLTPG